MSETVCDRARGAGGPAGGAPGAVGAPLAASELAGPLISSNKSSASAAGPALGARACSLSSKRARMSELL